MASAPVTFDARQWKRQVRAATGRTAAPGNVPLLTRRRAHPGRRDHPRGRLPVAAGLHPPGRRVHPAYGDHRRDRQSGRPT